MELPFQSNALEAGFIPLECRAFKILLAGIIDNASDKLLLFIALVDAIHLESADLSLELGSLFGALNSHGLLLGLHLCEEFRLGFSPCGFCDLQLCVMEESSSVWRAIATSDWDFIRAASDSTSNFC